MSPTDVSVRTNKSSNELQEIPKICDQCHHSVVQSSPKRKNLASDFVGLQLIEKQTNENLNSEISKASKIQSIRFQ